MDCVVACAKTGAVIREVVLVAGANSDASGVSSAEGDGLGSVFDTSDLDVTLRWGLLCFRLLTRVHRLSLSALPSLSRRPMAPTYIDF